MFRLLYPRRHQCADPNHQLATTSMWPIRLERTAWRELAMMPKELEIRRRRFLKQRTGSQLKAICEKFAQTGSAVNLDDALLRVYLRLAAHYSISRRVLSDCVGQLAPDSSSPRRLSMLCAGDTAATINAAEEVLGPSFKSICAVEATASRREAAEALLSQDAAQLTSFSGSLVDVALRSTSHEAYDLVACSWHLSELLDDEGRDAALAVLWGCIRPGGLLAIVESRPFEDVIQAARRRLIDPASHADPANRATVIAPCTTDGPCPLLTARDREGADPKDVHKGRCIFPQLVSPPMTGPPLRSVASTDAGAKLAKQNKTEFFSYIVLAKGVTQRAVADDDFAAARLIRTPTKRGGHVIFDLCMPDATRQRLTVSRKSLRDHITFPYKDARQSTHGSRLIYEVFKHARPKLPGWYNTLDMRKQLQDDPRFQRHFRLPEEQREESENADPSPGESEDEEVA